MARSIKDSLELYDSSMKSVSNALVDKGVAGTSKLSEVAERIRGIQTIGKPYLDKAKMADFLNVWDGTVVFNDAKPVGDYVDLSVDGLSGVVGYTVGTTKYITSQRSGVKVKVQSAENLFYQMHEYSTVTLEANDVLLTKEYWDNYLPTVEDDDLTKIVGSVNVKSTLEAKTKLVTNGETVELVDTVQGKESIRNLIINEMFDGETLNTSVVPYATANFARMITGLDITNLEVVDKSSLKQTFRELGQAKYIKGIENLCTSETKNISEVFQTAHSLVDLPISNWDTSQVTDMSSAFYNGPAFNYSTISSWNVQNVKNMKFTFANIRLDTLNLNSWKTSSLTNISNIFYFSTFATLSINSWDVSKVTDASYAFYYTTISSTLTLNSWRLTSLDNANNMFSRANISSINATGWGLGKATTLNYMFSSSKVATITGINGWDVSNVTDTSYMFSGNTSITSLNINSWNTSSLSKTSYMFEKCTALSRLTLYSWTTTSFSTAIDMFHGCTGLTTLNLSNWTIGSNVNVVCMFQGCSNLTKIVAKDWESPSNNHSVFADCSTKLKGGITWSSTKTTGAYCRRSTGYFSAS